VLEADGARTLRNESFFSAPQVRDPLDRSHRATMKSEFTYEVAVTFLSEHKAVALRIKDGLADRLSTFVYDREQPTVVGTNTDGVEAFSNVFRHESRVCVVLHSDGWGKVGYTHIEETAIKERALESGWDFLVVVCLDDAVPPKWIPTTKIWYGFKQYGLDGLIATIDNRATELGGRPKADSVLERAARAQRERDFAEEKRLFGSSIDGFQRVTENLTSMEKSLYERVAALNEVSPSLGLSFLCIKDPHLSFSAAGSQKSFAAVSNQWSFVLYWQPAYSNRLDQAGLLIVEWAGRFSYNGLGGGPPKLGSLSATPTIDYARQVVWEIPGEKPFTSAALIEFLLTRLIDGPPKAATVTHVSI